MATRLILLAWAVGLVAATVSGSDAVGWMAAVVAVALAVAVGRLMPNRFGGTACAVPQREFPGEVDVKPVDADVKVERTPV